MARTRAPVLPDRWLLTDPRMGDDAAVLAAAARLPRGGGIILRHYALPPARRRALATALRALARRRGLLLLLADPLPGMKGDGVHHPAWARQRAKGAGLRSGSAHDRRGLLAGFRGGADLMLLSPLFPTRSHPGGAALGLVRFGLIVRGMPGPVIALGGMDEHRARAARAVGAAGFAAIDHWLDDRRA